MASPIDIKARKSRIGTSPARPSVFICSDAAVPIRYVNLAGPEMALKTFTPRKRSPMLFISNERVEKVSSTPIEIASGSDLAFSVLKIPSNLRPVSSRDFATMTIERV